MKPVDEVEISKTILRTCSEKLLDHVASDVIIVGAGPSGLVAGFFLAKSGVKVTVLEKRLSPGGGIWGGGMGMNVAVVQEEVVPLLDEMGIRCHSKQDNLYAVDAVELAAGLCWNALQAGATVFNLLTAEDLCLRQDRVTGVVVNRTTISGTLPVDPIVLSGKAVLDATGHEAVLVECLRKRQLLTAAFPYQHGTHRINSVRTAGFEPTISCAPVNPNETQYSPHTKNYQSIEFVWARKKTGVACNTGFRDIS